MCGYNGPAGWLRSSLSYLKETNSRAVRLPSLFLEFRPQGIAGVLGVAEKHIGVGLEEDGVVDAGVARGHGALHDHHVLGVPHLEHRHARDDAVRVVDRGAVHRVVGTDDEHRVGLSEVLVDLLHLLDDLVRHARLGEEHVELARHAAGHGVDREAHFDAAVREVLDHVRDGVLRLGDGEAIARHDDHGAALLQLVHALGHVDLRVLALVDGHVRLARRRRARAEAAEDDAHHVAIFAIFFS